MYTVTIDLTREYRATATKLLNSGARQLHYANEGLRVMAANRSRFAQSKNIKRLGEIEQKLTALGHSKLVALLINERMARKSAWESSLSERPARLVAAKPEVKAARSAVTAYLKNLGR